MPLDPGKLIGRDFAEKRFSYTQRDSSLYALAVGMAKDPCNLRELDFVCAGELKVLPSQATVIAWDYDFVLESGIDQVMILHAAQSVTIHNPLPAAAGIISQFCIKALYDKGPGKGAVIIAETRIRDEATGKPLCTNLWTSYARGEGGFGGERGPGAEKRLAPGRAPDCIVDAPTVANQPLLYRLLGDVNPLHWDPEIARAAGFPRPIMHGNCTFGIACRAIVAGICDYEPERLASIGCDFTAPAMPGDTIRTEIWRDGDSISFRAVALERHVEVIGNGEARITKG